MIHGGGHMTLSRRAIRPAQTQHLLANGFLPVSIDYRLCPEVNLIDGPISDVLDAYRWARADLPRVASQFGCAVDAAKVVVVGWSTGGHLAMSIGWTAEEAGVPPPTAVLSFYAPYDFVSGGKEQKY
jgi:acetyl esterase/lipase